MIRRRREPAEGEGEDAAEQAARVATELSEAESLPDAPGRSDVAEARRPAGVRRAASAATDRTKAVAQAATATAGRSTRAAQRGMASGLTWLTGQVLAMGPRLKVRDQAALRKQFPGRSDDEIADLLVEHAGRASAAVGGATGAWAALPALPAFPAEIAAETLAVVGIEIKLVAELHEALGVPAPGTVTERARAYTAAWASRRGVSAVPGGLVLAAGSPLGRLLRRRLAARVRRSVFSLGPLLTGAVAGAMINRRETRKLGQEVLADLRRHQREIIKGAVVKD